LTAADCELLVHRTLAAGDAEGTVTVLKLLAVKDPARAQVLLDTIELGLAIARKR
jgi:hypothetical protein